MKINPQILKIFRLRRAQFEQIFWAAFSTLPKRFRKKRAEVLENFSPAAGLIWAHFWAAFSRIPKRFRKNRAEKMCSNRARRRRKIFRIWMVISMILGGINFQLGELAFSRKTQFWAARWIKDLGNPRWINPNSPTKGGGVINPISPVVLLSLLKDDIWSPLFEAPLIIFLSPLSLLPLTYPFPLLSFS